jgi:hypothetical protein
MYLMCKCKLFTLTWDLHAVYMAIDIHMHNIGLYMGYNPGGCLSKDTRLTLAPT